MNRLYYRNLTGTFFSGGFCVPDLPALYPAVTKYFLVFNKENPLKEMYLDKRRSRRSVRFQDISFQNPDIIKPISFYV